MRDAEHETESILQKAAERLVSEGVQHRANDEVARIVDGGGWENFYEELSNYYRNDDAENNKGDMDWLLEMADEVDLDYHLNDKAPFRVFFENPVDGEDEDGPYRLLGAYEAECDAVRGCVVAGLAGMYYKHHEEPAIDWDDVAEQLYYELELYWSENPADVYEWWHVESWLARKLRDAGEVVHMDLGIWGRQGTGQALSMDQAFRVIARDMGYVARYLQEVARDKARDTILQLMRQDPNTVSLDIVLSKSLVRTALDG
jgi:hypothetical protein